MNNQRFASQHSQRHAFTLLEIIFALALSLLLFSALLSAVEMYRRLSTAGRQEIEQAQLARTILRSMEIDIRSVVYQPPPVEDDEEEEEQSADEAATPESETDEEDTTEEEVLIDAAEVFGGESAGLFGDRTTLVIHAGRPPRRLETLLPSSPSSDLKSIAYFLATPGAAGLQGAAGSLLDTTGSGEAQGLSRLEGDRLALEFADTSGDIQALAAQTTRLAAEVDFLQFRYFDGQSWLDTWDTTAYERLPNAIEITLGINSQSDESRASRFHRFVVALPTAVPLIETTEDGA